MHNNTFNKAFRPYVVCCFLLSIIFLFFVNEHFATALPNYSSTKYSIVSPVDLSLGSSTPQKIATLAPTELCLLDNEDFIFRDSTTSTLKKFSSLSQTVSVYYGRGTSPADGIASTLAKGTVKYLMKNPFTKECTIIDMNDVSQYRVRAISNIDNTVKTIANISQATSIGFDEFGNIFTSEGSKIRMVNLTTGSISTVAGTSSSAVSIPADGSPTTGSIKSATSIIVRNGTVYFTISNSIMKIQNSSYFRVSGSWLSTCTYNVTYGGLASDACINTPKLITVIDNEIYFVDKTDSYFRKITKSGKIELVLGNGKEAIDLKRNDQVLQNVTLTMKGVSIIPMNGYLKYYISLPSNIIKVEQDSNIQLLAGFTKPELYSAFKYGLQIQTELKPIKTFRNGDLLYFSNDKKIMYKMSIRTGLSTVFMEFENEVTNCVVDKSTREDLYIVFKVKDLTNSYSILIYKLNIYSKSMQLVVGSRDSTQKYQYDGQSSLDMYINGIFYIKYVSGSLYFSTTEQYYLMQVNLTSLTVKKIMGVGYMLGVTLSGLYSDATRVEFESLDRIAAHPTTGSLFLRTNYLISFIDNQNRVMPFIGSNQFSVDIINFPGPADSIAISMSAPMVFHPNTQNLHFISNKVYILEYVNSTYVRQAHKASSEILSFTIRKSNGCIYYSSIDKGLYEYNPSTNAKRTLYGALSNPAIVGLVNDTTLLYVKKKDSTLNIYNLQTSTNTTKQLNYQQDPTHIDSCGVLDYVVGPNSEIYVSCTSSLIIGGFYIAKFKLSDTYLSPIVFTFMSPVSITLQNGTNLFVVGNQGVYKFNGTALDQIAGQANRIPIENHPLDSNGWTIDENGNVYFAKVSEEPIKKAVISEGVVVNVKGNGTQDNPTKFISSGSAILSDFFKDGTYFGVIDVSTSYWYSPQVDKYYSTPSYLLSLSFDRVSFTQDEDILFIDAVSPKVISSYRVSCERDKYDYCLQNFTCYGIFYNQNSSCSNRGDCTAENICECFDNYYSEDCSITTCFGIFSNQSNVCSGNGACNEFDNCECYLNYNGTNCNETIGYFNQTVNITTDIGSNSSMTNNYTSIENTTNNSTNLDNSTNLYNNSMINNSTSNSSNYITNSTFNSTVNSTWDGTNTTNNNCTICGNNSTITNSTNISNSSLESNNSTLNSTLNNTMDGTYNSTLNSTLNNTNFNNFTNGDNTTINSNTSSIPTKNTTILENSTSIYNNTINNTTISGNTSLTTNTSINNSTLGYVNNTMTNSSTITNNSTSNNSSSLVKCFGYEANDSRVCYGHGSCISNNTCQCNSLYEGAKCEKKKITCFGLLQSDPMTCSGHGSCSSEDYCICNGGYSGSRCFLSVSSQPNFNSLGNTLEFHFNSSIFISDRVLDCGKVVSETSLSLLGKNPSCFWRDGNFFIELGGQYSLIPQSTISLNTNSLDIIYIPDTIYVSLLVLPSNNPVKPTIDVSYKKVLGPCEEISIDASGSYCGDLKPVKFIWSIESSPDSNFNIQQVTFSDLNSTLTSNISISGRYVFGLIVESSLSGARSEKQLIEIFKSFVPNPTLSLLTSKMSLVNIEKSSLPIVVKKSIELPSCYFDNKQFDYTWEQVSGPASINYQVDSNNDLVITQILSSGDESYSFSVKAISKFNPNSNATLLITISTRARDLMLNTYVSNLNTNQAEVVIESSDPDNVDSVSESWSWSCFDRVTNQACQDTTVSNILTQCAIAKSTTCQVPKGGLSKATLQLNIQKGLRSISKSIDVDFPKTELLIAPVISLISVTPNRFKVLKDEILSLQLSVILGGDEKQTNEEDMIREWTINGNSLTNWMISKMSTDPSKSCSLILSLSELLEDGEYEIEFKVSDRRNGLSSKFTYKFKIVKSPKSCLCNITPSTGYALETQFSFSCPGCQNVEKSIDFVFGFVDEKSGTKIPLYNLGEKFASYLPSPFASDIMNTFVDIVDLDTGASVEFIKPVEVKTPAAYSLVQIKSKVRTWQSYAASLPSDSAKLIFNSATISRTLEYMISALASKSSRLITQLDIAYELRDEMLESMTIGLNQRNPLELISDIHFRVYIFGLESLASNCESVDSLPFDKLFNLTEKLVVMASKNSKFQVANGVDKLCSSLFNNIIRLLTGSSNVQFKEKFRYRVLTSMKKFSNVLMRNYHVGQKDYNVNLAHYSTISLLRYKNQQLKKEITPDSGNSSIILDGIDVSNRKVLETSFFSMSDYLGVSDSLKQATNVETIIISNLEKVETVTDFNSLTNIVSLDKTFNADITTFTFKIGNAYNFTNINVENNFQTINNTIHKNTSVLTTLECLPLDHIFQSSSNQSSCSLTIISSPFVACTCSQSVTSLVVIEKTIAKSTILTTPSLVDETISPRNSSRFLALYGLYGLFGLVLLVICCCGVFIIVMLMRRKKKKHQTSREISNQKDVEMMSV